MIYMTFMHQDGNMPVIRVSRHISHATRLHKACGQSWGMLACMTYGSDTLAL